MQPFRKNSAKGGPLKEADPDEERPAGGLFSPKPACRADIIQKK